MKSPNENLGERCSIHKLHHLIETMKKKALNSDLQYKHSACLIHRNKMISIGLNKYIKMSKIDYKTSVHAEIDAILQSDIKEIKGLDIIIIRVKKLANGELVLKNSRPCNNCIDKMKTYGIRKVYYSNDNGDIVYEFLESMPKIHISSGTILKKYMNNIDLNNMEIDIEKTFNKIKSEIKCI